MSNRKFETVSGGSNGVRWEPQMKEKNFMKMSDDNVRIGYLLGSKLLPGNEGKDFTVFSLQEVDDNGKFGKVWDFTGDAVLMDKLKEVPFGSFVRIEYKGRLHKAAVKKTPGYTPEAPFTQANSYHNWEVGVDRGALPYAEAAKTQSPETPVQSVQQNNIVPVASGSSDVNADDLPF